MVDAPFAVPGDTVRQTGVYRATHGMNAHAQDHEVVCLNGDAFPRCNLCGDAVRFVLVKGFQYVGNNAYFV